MLGSGGLIKNSTDKVLDLVRFDKTEGRVECSLSVFAYCYSSGIRQVLPNNTIRYNFEKIKKWFNTQDIPEFWDKTDKLGPIIILFKLNQDIMSAKNIFLDWLSDIEFKDTKDGVRLIISSADESEKPVVCAPFTYV